MSEKTTMNSFANFIHKYKVTVPGQPCTHTSMSGGKYNIPEGQIDTFYDLYCKNYKENKICMTESNSDLTPLKVDFDFRYQSTTLERRYDKNDINKILKLYGSVIDDWVNYKKNNKGEEYERFAFVMEKEAPRENKKISDEIIEVKDGIHIMFPYLVLPAELQHKIREHVFPNLHNILGHMQLTNKYSDVVDRAVIDKNNWLMYGSMKPNDTNAYLITSIQKVETDNITKYDKKYSELELIRLLSIRNRDSCHQAIIKSTRQSELQELIEANQAKIESKASKKKKKSKADQRTIETAKQLLEMLNPQRADSYNSWIEVGWALHNIDDSLLSTWIEFSQKSIQYKGQAEESCLSHWDKMREDGLTEGTIRYWAKKDNPSAYAQFLREDINTEIIKQCKSKKEWTSWDIAHVVYKMYRHEFVCCHDKKGLWYNYDGSRWLNMEENVILKKRISTELYQEYIKVHQKLLDSSEEAGDLNFKRAENIMEIVRNLKQTTHKSNIMKECAEHFYKQAKDFYNKLDTEHSHELIAFENGVYDLSKSEFRDGRPDDLISNSTNIEYQEYNPNDYNTQKVMEFISKVLVDKDIREYVLLHLASCLSGSTRDEKFHIWCGSGGNGKSKLIELLEMCLGEYTTKLPVEALTKGRSKANEASPSTARLRGKRIAVLQEPSEGAKLDAGTLKELTGGDKIQARELFAMPIEFKPQAKFILTCNDKPKVPSHDGGVWRRLVVIDFQSKFVENPDPNNPYEFEVDHDLSTNFENWKESFISILIHYYKKYRDVGLKVPQAIRKFTESYRRENDHFSEFIDERISEVQLDEEKAFISSDILYKNYKEWANGTGYTSNLKKKCDLIKYLEEKFGLIQEDRPGQKGWYNFKISGLSSDVFGDEL